MAKLVELAAHLGLSPARVSQLKATGVLPNSPRGKIDLDAARGAYLAYLRQIAAGRMSTDGDALDLVAERAKLAAAQSAKIEMQNAVMRGEQIMVAETRMLVTTAFARVRSKLLALPSKLAPPVVGVSESAEAQKILRAAIHEALDELAATRASDCFEDGDDGPAAA